MSNLDSAIRALDQRPCYRVRVNGTELYDAVAVQLEASFDQFCATARVSTVSRYNLEPGAVYAIEIWEGYNGFMDRTFTGFIDDLKLGRFPNTYELICRDVLKKAVDTWLDDTGVEYNQIQAEAAVVDLLGKAGISNVDAQASNFTLADVKKATFKLVSVMDAVQQIAALIGWQVWATSDGVVHFKYRKPLPSANSFWDYADGPGGNLLKSEYTETDRNLRNRIVVIGYDKIKATAQADSPYVPDPPKYRTAILSSELVDTQRMAEVIARWMLNDLNHLTESLDLQIVGNPRLKTGMTIHVRESGWSGQNANFFVFSLRSDNQGDRGYTMDLTVIGGNSSPIDYGGDGGDGSGADVVASFTVKQVAWGDPTYVVYVDASASYAPDGQIASYTWDWGDGTSETNTRAGASHKYAAAGPATITLTVTADTGKSGTASQQVDVGNPDDASIVQKVLHAAGAQKVYGSADSGATWKSAVISSQATSIDACAEKENGAVIVGCTGGQLYRVLGYGASVALIRTFGAGVGSVHVARNDDSRWLVGLSNGELWKGEGYGAAWTLLYTFPGAINRYAFWNPANEAEMFAPVNPNHLYHSLDGGATWLDLLATYPEQADTTEVRYLAWHLLQHIGLAATGANVGALYSGDDGATWTDSIGLPGQAQCITGGPYNPGDYAVGCAGQNAAYIAADGITFSRGGDFYQLPQADDLRYDGDLAMTLYAGG